MGLSTFDGTWTVFNDSLDTFLFRCITNSIVPDTNGVVWIGTTHGVGKYNGTNWTIYDTSNSCLSSVPYSIVFDKNNHA